jgi:Chitobiase/beta-hexosaminidase C-terminal domain/FG-GAP-like repeat/Beta xylosidase C-terminal Concanavalin A-like domain
MNFFAVFLPQFFSRHVSLASSLVLAWMMTSGVCSTAIAQAPVADDFNGTTLNTALWTVVAPAGGSAAVSNGHLLITVPGGSNHDAFTPALDAVQVEQQVSNANFDVNVKIDSTIAASGKYSGQGLLVEGDAHDYIRFEISANGSSISLSANTIIGGTQSSKFQLSPFSGYVVPTYLRLNRTGSTYTGYYSADGVNWTKAGSFTDSSLTVTGLALYGSNYQSTPSNAPAITPSFDWFHNTTTTPTVATPTFSPASGTSFSSTLSVSINESTTGSTIYYTTDGSTPTTSSAVYSSAITIDSSTTFNAIAVASGVTSAVGSASYTLTSQSSGAPVNDDFNGSSLNPSLWTVVAPAGGSATVSNGHLVITVPGGSNHDAFNPALDAVQVEQKISNANFDVNVKIDSTIAASGKYSGQGLLVEGDAHDYIRFEISANGSSISLSANTIIGGTQSSKFQLSPFSGYVVPTYLRMNRTGSTYTGYYSADGVNWTKAGSFTDSSLTVTGLALYGSNYQSTPSNAPAITPSFDWFHNTTTTPTVATPTLSPASGTNFSSTLSVSIADSTPGATIYYTTNGSTPTTSSAVYSGPITLSATTTIQALATASGFAPSGIASASYTQSAAVTATPIISPASGTTFSSTLSVSISDSTSGAIIYYTTDGTTPSTSSSVYSNPFTISTSTTVEAIAAANGLTQSGVASASYTLSSGSGGGVVSDNLDGPALNTSLWTIENPLGDGTVVMSGSGANLNVPMGRSHDLWTSGANAVRIMQPIANSDFSVDVRFQSAVEIGNQDEGIMVEQDSTDFLRFDVLFAGTTGPELFAAGISGGKATTFVSAKISLAKGPLWLRLSRSGNVWTGSWSADGTNFLAAPSFTFDLNAAKIGPYGGNSNTTASNSPGFTAVVDYFFATSDPIANQDGPRPYGYVTVDANPASTLVEKALADIQGTGHLEPVIGLERESQANNNGASGIYWYEYPASGNINDPWIRHTIIGSGDGYEDMVPFDVNGDGAVDIVCSFDPTFSGKPEIVWFQNPRGQGGNPITDTWTMHVVGPGQGENNLLIGDIDGDGKMDIVTPSSVFFQNSSSSWTQVQYSQSFRGVGLLDIGSGKGSINLAGTQPASPYNIGWWENPRETGGNSRTGAWTFHSIGPGYPCSPDNCSGGSGSGEVAAYNAADMNGDGMMDVISGQSEAPGGGVAPPPGGMIWWEAPSDRRNGSWIKHTMDFNMVDVHKIQVGDMDKNGTLDVLAVEQDQSPLDRVAVFYNDGKGNLTEQIISNAKGHNDPIGDVTGNGSLDILNSGHGYFNDSHPLQIFLNPY